ncbi:MAG: ATP-dependent DNA helicase RecG [Hungatella sp.]
MKNNQESVYTLKGIGEKTGKLLEKLGIFTLEDLLHYYPRAYHTYEPPVMVEHLKPDTVGTVGGLLQKDVSVKRLSHIQVITTTFQDGSGKLQLTWFHMPFLRATLKAGTYHIFHGKVTKKNNRLTMEQPEIFTKEAYEAMMQTMQPVYGQTKGLNNKAITKAVAQALENRQMEREYLPADIRKKYQLAEYNFALERIHFPDDRQELLFARKRLVFDEFFLFLLAVRKLREKRMDRPSPYVMAPVPEVEKFRSSLPYELTGAQQKVLREIQNDLAGGQMMNRLVQGDVGSGKTIIAILALLQTAYHGYQGALMAPTEVLARQHYEGMVELFETYHIPKVPVLVTGSMTAKEKRIAYEKIASHEADIVIGTHALIQDKVVYDKLALVITDEQHRFGVGQREMLGNKGEEPHVLVMSATPIPRTLAIIIYGDLDISVIDELPANRLPIKNCVVGTDYRKTAYSFLAKQIAQGRQAYVICPMVEASEMIEAENVLNYTKTLKEVLPGISIEYLHGKMKGKEKNKIMDRFASGEIQILVSTTVIEVGVNVPNATVMMIENAERFGLAQLHQLRGRVGRGKYQSYCIMVNGSDQDGTQERLDILNRSNDGFYIASEDLKLRGPGDIFGIRQSGDMEFRLADIFTDASLLKTVSEEVNVLLAKDPELKAPGHEELKRRLEDYLQQSYERLNL